MHHPGEYEMTVSGDRHLCPCCGQSCDQWLDFSSTYRNVVCPHCHLQPRHRSLQLYLQTRTSFYTAEQKVLHFAPEQVLREAFAPLPNLDYITADLNDPSVDIKIDITQIPFADNSFDVIFCSHVLEHVPDDAAAMRELFRVLKPGGWAFLQVPLDFHRQQTFEDPTITSPEDRDRYFWQYDHVRLYGLDYKERLQAVGFTVRIEEFTREIGAEAAEKYGLDPTENLYFGFKPIAVPVQPTPPRVSVIIPAHNYGQYVCQAIESALSQSYESREIIVVDDGSIDQTREILQPYRDRIRYVYQPNQGAAAARNYGVKFAKGEFVIFLDADDFFLPDLLQSQVACFSADPAIDIVVCGWQLVNEGGEAYSTIRLWNYLPQLSLEAWLMWRPVLPSATMYRRDRLIEVGGFRGEFFPAEDVDLMLRLSLVGCRSSWLQQVGVCYRQHSQAITQNINKQVDRLEAVYKQFFARADLPDAVQQLESRTYYHLIVWLAWRFYFVGNFSKMSEYLQQSLVYSPFSAGQAIENWIEVFANSSSAYGHEFSSYKLSQLTEWQQLLQTGIAIKPPRVSVIIPTFNNAKFILQAVESVLQQTYRDYELLVIDDGSTDETRSILQPYQDRIRYLYHENRGVSAARNRGLYLARGEFVALLDGDDYFLPEKLAQQTAVFDANPGVGIVNSGFRVVSHQGNVLADMQWWHGLEELSLETWLLYKPVLPSAMMFRLDWLKRVGGFDRRFPPAEDLDITFRLALAGCEAAWLPQVTICYRLHDTSASSQSTPKMAQSVEAVLTNLFARDDLPEQVRNLEARSRYQVYVWLAWRLYQTDHLREMQEQLEKSLRYTPFSIAETITNWVDCFKVYSQGFGYHFNGQALSSLPEWKQAVRSAVGGEKQALAPQTQGSRLVTQ